MAKEVAGQIKLQIKGGAANPSPPVGPALGSKGINIMEFCKQFNARTQDKAGKILPVLLTMQISLLILLLRLLRLLSSYWRLQSRKVVLLNLTVPRSLRLLGIR